VYEINLNNNRQDIILQKKKRSRPRPNQLFSTPTFKNKRTTQEKINRKAKPFTDNPKAKRIETKLMLKTIGSINVYI
jgi:hypothetical protein